MSQLQSLLDKFQDLLTYEEVDLVCSDSPTLPKALLGSKIAYGLVTGKIPNPKRALVLTYNLLELYALEGAILSALSSVSLDADRICVFDPKQFYQNILSKYGYLLDPQLHHLKDDLFNYFQEKDYTLQELNTFYDIPMLEAAILKSYANAVEQADTVYLAEELESYTTTLTLIPEGNISYNGLAALTIRLFTEFPNILQFYQRYYPFIILSAKDCSTTLDQMVIAKLITPNTHLISLEN
jgi:hypothetical protein